VAAREQSARKRSSRRGKNKKKRHFARTDPSMNVDES
jgi:ribosomal protein L32